ncbi:MAG: NAD(P)H-dependent oxidoreductase [Chloroflexi bacterium]|nr:NAD(P)H-dependent oxidoreductase [Chloroflexota bacterium]
MKTLILNGANPTDSMGRRLNSLFQAQSNERGWEAESILLCEQKIGNCAGDFFCWMRSPGICNTDDDNRVIAAKVIQSDLVIFLTPVTFGGFSSQLKRMLDHLIQNILPFFTSINGEIHHQKRYEKYPNILVVGWQSASNSREEVIFRHLVHRMSINMNAKTTVCGLMTDQPSEADLTTQADSWLEAVANSSSSPVPALPTPTFPSTDAASIRFSGELSFRPIESTRCRNRSHTNLHLDQFAGKNEEVDRSREQCRPNCACLPALRGHVAFSRHLSPGKDFRESDTLRYPSLFCCHLQLRLPRSTSHRHRPQHLC